MAVDTTPSGTLYAAVLQTPWSQLVVPESVFRLQIRLVYESLPLAVRVFSDEVLPTSVNASARAYGFDASFRDNILYQTKFSRTSVWRGESPGTYDMLTR